MINLVTIKIYKMKIIIFFICSILVSTQTFTQQVYASKDIKKQKTDVVYDYSCMEFDNDYGTNNTIITLGDLTRDIQEGIKDINGIKFTVENQMEWGDYYFENYWSKKFDIDNDGKEHRKLKRILNDLLKRLAFPIGIEYKIHYVESDDLNAYAAIGGHIFVNSALYDFFENDSEMAAIIAHEIAHIELGHVADWHEKMFVAKRIGVPSDIANTMLSFEKDLLVSFNQKQEAEADLFGIDILFPTGYSKCASINFWERLASDERESNVIGNILRSHPYSKVRAVCIENHLEKNYNYNCNF